jgi:hypothetical protein
VTAAPDRLLDDVEESVCVGLVDLRCDRVDHPRVRDETVTGVAAGFCFQLLPWHVMNLRRFEKLSFPSTQLIVIASGVGSFTHE